MFYKLGYAKYAGIKTIRIHNFRHSHASFLANEGINIQDITRRLGHSKIEITWNTYAHLYPAKKNVRLIFQIKSCKNRVQLKENIKKPPKNGDSFICGRSGGT